MTPSDTPSPDSCTIEPLAGGQLTVKLAGDNLRLSISSASGAFWADTLIDPAALSAALRTLISPHREAAS